jgi:hypothetical protein
VLPVVAFEVYRGELAAFFVVVFNLTELEPEFLLDCD